MKYDTTLKALLRQAPPVALHQLSGETIARWSPVELPKVQNLRTDLLGETNNGNLIQIEIQSDNDPRMPFRMLQYSVAITDLYNRVPQQVLLYVGSGPLTMPPYYEWDFGSARYTLINLRDLDGEALLSSSNPSDNVLGLLARLQDRRLAVRTVVTKLLQLDRAEFTAYARALLILGGLRVGLAAEIEEAMTYEFDPAILENEVLGPIYREGKQEGKQEGIQEVLLSQVERRFGPLPPWADQRFKSLSEPELKDLAVRLLDVSSLDQLLRP